MHRDMGQPSLAEVLVSETLGQNGSWSESPPLWTGTGSVNW